MPVTRLILVGGFLGAGKTTLLAQAAKRLDARGLSVGLVTNDQAEDLVDTKVLQEQGLEVREVSGGCFCCRFGCLLTASDLLSEDSEKDVLLAEPVGSCTDISATVLQPLKEFYSGHFSVAPYSVLADPARLRQTLAADAENPLPKKVAYIYRTQLEEADLIVLNKVDLLSGDQIAELKELVSKAFPDTPVLEMSALQGRGVDAWLDLLVKDDVAGERIAEVDYDTYAEGEAALGWLNAAIRLRAEGEVDWGAFSSALLERMQQHLRSRSAEIAHVKLTLEAGGDQLFADLTGNQDRPFVRGALGGSPRQVALTFNARAHVGPEELRQALDECLAACAADGVRAEIDDIQNFSPARPEPTHRFEQVASAPSAAPAAKADGAARVLRKVVAAVLLAFVASSITYLVTKEIVARASGNPTAAADAAKLPLADGVNVVFFHPNVRCASCRRIEQWSRQAVEAGFAKQTGLGRLNWRAVNYENPANAPIAAQYGVYTSSIVLIEARAGKALRWQRLDRLWELLSDEQAFTSHVRDRLRDYLEGR